MDIQPEKTGTGTSPDAVSVEDRGPRSEPVPVFSRAVIAPKLWIIALVLVAAAAGIVATVTLDYSGEQGNQLGDEFQYKLADYQKIDPALIQYRQVAAIAVPLQEPAAVAVGPEDEIFVAGDQAVVVFDPQTLFQSSPRPLAGEGLGVRGGQSSQFSVEGRPRCIAVAGNPPLVYLGMEDHVEVYGQDGVRHAAWQTVSKKSYLTSIAVGENDVFVADAGEKIVYRYDLAGKLLGRIGARNPEKEIFGFIVPSPYFDLALAPDGLLRVVNPALHRIEAYTAEGDYEHPLTWGKASLAIEGFCGCCNPSNIAVLPDGGFVTAEKGILRVKVYSPEGQFVSVVAGPELLAPHETAAEETRPGYKMHVVDVAADRQGRVLVLDPQVKLVRVFEHMDRPTDGRSAGEKP